MIFLRGFFLARNSMPGLEKITLGSANDTRRLSWLWPLAAFVAVSCLGSLLVALWERRIFTNHLQEERLEVVSQISALRSGAEIAINARVHITTALKAHVSINPDIDSQEFETLAKLLSRETSGIRSMTLIKNNVISDVYPREGNESALGLNLLEHPQQRAAVERVIQSRRSWLTGPVELQQGGQAFINRAPVYLPETGLAGAVEADSGEQSTASEAGKEEYWGMVSILIDKSTLLDEIRRYIPESLDVAIKSGDEDMESSRFFLGRKLHSG